MSPPRTTRTIDAHFQHDWFEIIAPTNDASVPALSFDGIGPSESLPSSRERSATRVLVDGHMYIVERSKQYTVPRKGFEAQAKITYASTAPAPEAVTRVLIQAGYKRAETPLGFIRPGVRPKPTRVKRAVRPSVTTS